MNTKVHVAIERMTPKHIGDTANVLTRAFYDNPMAQAAFGGDPKKRLPRVRRIYRNMVKQAERHGTVYVVRRGGRIVAAMLAYQPGAYPLPATRRLLNKFNSLRVGLGPSMRYGLYYRAIDKLHPPQAHWYLQTLGVGPGNQGRGYGQALLKQFIHLSDSEQALGYLETDREDLVQFYQGHGFGPCQELEVPGLSGFKVWCLQREPAAKRPAY